MMYYYYMLRYNVVNKYIDKTIRLPYFVSYALENRTPYYFYHDGVKQEVTGWKPIRVTPQITPITVYL